MISTLLAAVVLVQTPAKPIRILFIGNSFTGGNDLPRMVKSLLESDGSGRRAEVKFQFSAHLNDLYKKRGGQRLVSDGKWDWVVLEGAMVSMSHKYTYPQDGAIGFGKLAKKSGAKPLFWSEWSRQGIDETEYTENIYRQIAKEVGAPVAPVGRVWDAVRKRAPRLTLWQDDGNHATTAGTFIAAATIYYFLAGKKREPTWSQPGLEPSLVATIRREAKALAP